MPNFTITTISKKIIFISLFSNNPKGRVPRALPVGEWELAHKALSIACVLK
jgi:hypothetical protein